MELCSGFAVCEWVVARLKEGNTWRGIVLLATSAGLVLTPLAWEIVIAVGMAAAGVLDICLRETRSMERSADVGRCRGDVMASWKKTLNGGGDL
jgi:hypothetical protein